jgi:mannitol/fructose-specific phosphotransferase system IIA component (Ntr-type)
MEIYKRLRTKHIFLNASLKDKDEVIRFVADTFARDGVVANTRLLYESMKKREKTMSTGIGDGIGIPNAASWETNEPALLLIRLADPIDFEALDGLYVDTILALVVPENRTHLHLQILARISRLCKRTEFLGFVRQANNSNDLWEEIRRIEEEIAFH